MPTLSADNDKDLDSHEQPTLVGHRPPRFHDPSQGNFVASSSYDLFHLTSGIPHSYSYHLPNVLYNLNPRYHAYNHQNRPSLPPNPSSSTSYNNSFFSIPPLPHLDVQSSITPPPHHMASRRLGPPPPIPPRPIVFDQPVPHLHLQSPFDPVMRHHTVDPQTLFSHPSYRPYHDVSPVHRAPSPSVSPPSSTFLSVSKTYLL